MEHSSFPNDQQLIYFDLHEKKVHIKCSISTKALADGAIGKERRIWINRTEIIPEISFSLRPCYGLNFGWGSDAGPANFNTALSMCCCIFRNERISENLFIPFKEYFVDLFPDSNFETDIDLEVFLQENRYRLHPYLYSCFCKEALMNYKEILVYKNPETGKIFANLAENYAIQNTLPLSKESKKLDERKQRLLFRLFARENYLITGYTFEDVIKRSGEVMSRFYQKSFERILKKFY